MMPQPLLNGDASEPELPTGNESLPATNGLSQWDRLLRDPSVTVEKLQAFFALHERQMAREAEAAFDAAFSDMQGELPTIDKTGKAVMGGQVRYTHAVKADIVEAVKPVLAKYGFAIRFEHEYPDGLVRVIGILSHRNGHKVRDVFQAEPDKSGSKNDIQAVGSTRTYGERYTTCSLLNIVDRDPTSPARDTDGHRQSDTPSVLAPTGFEAWWCELMAAAPKGSKALKQVYERPDISFRTHLNRTNRDGWMKLKAQAEQVSA